MLNVALQPTPRNRRPLAGGYVPSVAVIAAAMLARDGMYHHGARYFASAGDAALVRHLAAERMRRDAVRGVPSAVSALRTLTRPVLLVPTAESCPWCRDAIGVGEPTVPSGGRLLHEGCADALEVVLASRGIR